MSVGQPATLSKLVVTLVQGELWSAWVPLVLSGIGAEGSGGG